MINKMNLSTDEINFATESINETPVVENSATETSADEKTVRIFYNKTENR